MKFRFRPIAVVAALAATALTLTACAGTGNGATETPDASAPEGTTETAQQVVVDISFDLITADPARQFETTGAIVMHAVYDTLVTASNDDDATAPQPNIATEWVANDDATEYTFTLRDDIEFSDGTPLTSEDVVFSLNRVKNIQGNGSFLLDGLTVEAPDATTIVVTSEGPNTAIPAILTSPTLSIVNKKVVEENGGTDAEGAADSDTAQAFLDGTSAGSGAYLIEKFDTTVETILTVNPNYWGEKPKYDRVVLRNATADAQLMDIQSGTADIAVDLGSDQTATLTGNDNLIVTSNPTPTMYFLLVNANPEISEITSTQDFRDAVKYGIDREALLELAGDGASIAYGLVPFSFLGALGEEDDFERDVDRAKEAVERLGGNISVELEYPGDMTANGLEFGPFGERIAAQLAEVGINVTLKPSPVATALETYRAGTQETGFWFWSPDYPDSASYLAFGPGALLGDRSGWAAGTASDLEEVMAETAVETDDAKREALYEEFQRLNNDYSVLIPLFHPAATVVSTTDVGVVKRDPSYTLDIAEIGR